MLLTLPDPSTAALQTCAGLTSLELDSDGQCAGTMPKAIADVARLDAYAARDVLHHPIAASVQDAGSPPSLNAVIAAVGLGSGVMSAHQHQALTTAVAHADIGLKRLLETEPDPGQERMTGRNWQILHRSPRCRRFSHSPPKAASSAVRDPAPAGFPHAGTSGLSSTTE
ncbi:hypothetical protein ACWGRF_04095 [Streptomyces zhihengii]